MRYFVIEDLELDLKHGGLKRIVCKQTRKGKFMIAFKFKYLPMKVFYLKSDYGYLFFKELRFYEDGIELRYYDRMINNTKGSIKVPHKWTGICTDYPLEKNEIKFIIDMMIRYREHIVYYIK